MQSMRRRSSRRRFARESSWQGGALAPQRAAIPGARPRLDNHGGGRGDFAARRRPVAELWNVRPKPVFHCEGDVVLSVVQVSSQAISHTTSLGDDGVKRRLVA